jgi:hypothetical protein
MSSTQSQPESGGEAGRVRCLYCGANNFPAAAVCWQCGRPLKPVQSGQANAGTASSPIASGQMPGLQSTPTRPALIESALAPKAAAAMGLLFPYIGLPAGILFLMLDDPRKTQLGWLLIGWSLLGGVLNAITLGITLVPMWGVLKDMLPHGGSPGGAPNGLPGMPNLSGDGAGWLFPRLITSLFFHFDV